MRVAFSEYDRYGRQSGHHLIACEEHGRAYAQRIKARWPEGRERKVTTISRSRHKTTITILREPSSQDLPCHFCEPDVELSETKAVEEVGAAFERRWAEMK